MPIHQGWLPREGFTAGPLLNIIGKTAFNPALLLPLILLARFSKKGEDISILHPLAFSRVKTLFYLGLAKWVSAYYSDKVVNNWTSDTYVWPKEIAVVTGGAGGIGGHLVKLLEEKGLTVVVLDIQPMTFKTGAKTHYYKVDLTSAANVAEVAKKVRAELGDPTILVNNAGVARGKTILETSERDLQFTFDVNVFAHFHTVKEFLPAMIKKNHGMIVTVASFAAWLTVPNMVDYGASKAAAFSFHEGLAAELATRYKAPRVRTVVVNQGYTKTALFTGYHNDSPFLVPALEPETVADAIATQIFTGKSGQVITPVFGSILQSLRAMPHWHQYKLRAKGENIMTKFSGRQVVENLQEHYKERDAAKDAAKAAKASETEGSTVLVPKPT